MYFLQLMNNEIDTAKIVKEHNPDAIITMSHRIGR